MRDSLYRTFLDVPPDLTGRGTCIAVVDGDFRPHPDIASTERRTTRFVRAADEAPEVVRFEDAPGPWPGGAHGLWAAAVAAGTGAGAGGPYAGVAPDADLLLMAGWRPGLPTGQNHARITRTLHWLLGHWREYALRAVVAAVTPEADPGILPWPCDPVRLVGEALAAEGLLVVGGAGNVPDLTAQAAPAGAPSVLAVGGAILPDGGFRERAVWDPTCNGETFDGRRVPDLLGPATGCVVPVAPGGEDLALWEPVGDGYARASGGTSDAGPSVLGAAACVWQAHPEWTAHQMAVALRAGAAILSRGERIGAGLVSVSRAIRQEPGPGPDLSALPFARRKRWRAVDEAARVRAFRTAAGEDLVDVLLAVLPEGAAGTVAEAVRPLLRHGLARVRAAALCALAAGPEALEWADVRDAFVDHDARVRAAGLFTLRCRPDLVAAEGCVSLLAHLLEDASVDVGFMAARLAERAGVALLVPALAVGLEGDAREGRRGCFFARCRALRALTGYDVPLQSVRMDGSPEADAAVRAARVEVAAGWRRAVAP